MQSVKLTQKEVDELLELIRTIDDDVRVSLRERQIAIGKYMLCSGVGLQELLVRFEAVCPAYLDKEKIRDSLRYTGIWVDHARSQFYSTIFSNSWGGAMVDSKAMLVDRLTAWSEARLCQP